MPLFSVQNSTLKQWLDEYLGENIAVEFRHQNVKTIFVDFWLANDEINGTPPHKMLHRFVWNCEWENGAQQTRTFIDTEQNVNAAKAACLKIVRFFHTKNPFKETQKSALWCPLVCTVKSAQCEMFCGNLPDACDGQWIAANDETAASLDAHENLPTKITPIFALDVAPGVCTQLRHIQFET